MFVCEFFESLSRFVHQVKLAILNHRFLSEYHMYIRVFVQDLADCEIHFNILFQLNIRQVQLLCALYMGQSFADAWREESSSFV